MPRRLLILASLAVALLAPASAHAAFVTADDVSVRPAEGSPWSKGTLFKGQGFQVGATTSNGWAYGRATGEAERCGWVLISQINSTTRTDTSCGAPKSEPLGDREHVPGGGPSERWYVTCDSATLHGNYGGPGQLRSPTSSVGLGTPVGWRYTTGDGYAASIDGPTGTPRFILRECVSRTPSEGGDGDGGDADGGDAEGLDGPDLYRLLDEDQLFERFGGATVSRSSRASAARRRKSKKSRTPKVTRTRATIRIAPNNLIIANGLREDTFKAGRGACEGWVYGTITRKDTKVRHSGWVQAAGLSPRPKGKGGCGRVVPYGKRVGFVNAPSRSVTYRAKARAWTTTGAPSTAYLQYQQPGCALHMNYTPGVGLQDPVTGPVQATVFKNGDNSSLAHTIGYRYTTADGAAALISAKSGFRSGKKKLGLWGFVARRCVVPTDTRGGSAAWVYQREIRICDRGVLPSKALRTLNSKKARSKRIRRVSPCRVPNKPANKPGNPSPDSRRDGWRFGKLRR